MRNIGIWCTTCLALGIFSGTLNAQINERPKEIRTVRHLLAQSQRPPLPYTIRYDGKQFVVDPEVFSPKYFPDTYWFEKNLRIQPGDSFLEIGSGTGLISVMAAIKGAGQVTAVDINPAAVKNTTENVFLNHVSHKFRIYEGDVFDPIPKGQKFDVIFWFAPFMHVDMERGNLTELERSVFDPNYNSLKKYLSQARNFLRPDGKLYLGFSPTHGQFEVLEKFAQENGWKVDVVAREVDQIPFMPGIDQVDFITVMLLELKPDITSETAEMYDTPMQIPKGLETMIRAEPMMQMPEEKPEMHMNYPTEVPKPQTPHTSQSSGFKKRSHWR